jgi:hypothetical protein
MTKSSTHAIKKKEYCGVHRSQARSQALAQVIFEG